MTDLTGEQYESVLAYMETANEEDYDHALIVMKSHSFNIHDAIQSRFNPRNSDRQSQRSRDSLDHDYQRADVEIVRKYLQYVQRKNQSWSFIGSTFGMIKNLVVGLSRGIAMLLLPESLLMKILHSQFYKLYSRNIKLEYRDKKLKSLLESTRNHSNKAVILAISTHQSQQCFLELFNKNDIVHKIELNFLFCGYIFNQPELNIINQDKIPPQIIVCRMNIFEEIIILHKFIGVQEIKLINTQKLQNLSHESRNLYRRDNNVLVKYRNFQRKSIGDYFEEEQEDEVNFVERKQESEYIKQQNQQYKKVEEETTIRMKEENEKKAQQEKQLKILEELNQERKFRKMSMPDEPTEGEIIRISFRCPDGSTKIRNFNSDEKIELIYHWVELNEEIEFEDEKRQFEMLYSYPPRSLVEQKQKLLKDVFEGLQEKVLIRQL